MAMTNGEHDTLWIRAAKALPSIADTLQTANTIACIKELYVLGEIEIDDYKASLLSIIKSSGYNFTIKSSEKKA